MRLDVMPVPRRKVRRVGLYGLADDFGAPASTGSFFGSGDSTSNFISNLSAPNNLALTDFGSASSPYPNSSNPAANSGSLSSSPINWNSMLPGLVGAGINLFNTSTAADVQKTAIGANAATQQQQATYGIAPPGYTYRGVAYNVQSSTGSSMPAGYTSAYSPSTGYAQVVSAQSGMSSTTLLLLLGAAAFVMSQEHGNAKK